MEVEKKSEKYTKDVGKFYIYSRFFFKFFGLWTLPKDSSFLLKFFHLIYFMAIVGTWYLLYDFMLLLNMIVNIDDLQLVLSVFFILSTFLSCLGKFIKVRYSRETYKSVMELLHHEDFHPSNLKEQQFFEEAVSENQRVKKSYTALTLLSVSTLVINAVIKGYPAFPFEAHPILDITKNHNYFIVFMYQVIGVGCQCAINISFDTIFCSFFIFLSCQLRIFEYKLRNLSAKNDFEIHTKLTKLVKLHLRILELSDGVQNCVVLPLTIQMLSSTIVIMTIFFNLSKVIIIF